MLGSDEMIISVQRQTSNTKATSPWRRKWQPTPVFLPGESPWTAELAGHSPWGHKESAMTEWLSTIALYLRFNFFYMGVLYHLFLNLFSPSWSKKFTGRKKKGNITSAFKHMKFFSKSVSLIHKTFVCKTYLQKHLLTLILISLAVCS